MPAPQCNNRETGLRHLAKGISDALIGDVVPSFKQCGHGKMDYESYRAGWIEGRHAFYAELQARVVR